MNNIIYRTKTLSSFALFGSLRANNHNLNKTPNYFSTSSKGKPSQNIMFKRKQKLNVFKRCHRNVSKFSQHQDYLQLVPVGDGVVLKLPYLWLRDHCRCSECYSYETNQRTFDTFTINLNEAPINIEIEQQIIKITWRDNHKSTFDLKWLKENAPGSSLKEVVNKILWDGQQIRNEMPADVPYDEFMQNDESLKSILMNIHKYGFGIVGGCPLTEEKTKEVSERIGHVLNTHFGASWSFTNDEAMDDSSYTSEGIGAHNDNTYFLDPSGIQVLHCIYHDGTGGENLLVDGFKAATNIKVKHPDYYEALVRIPVQAEYIGDGQKLISTMNLLNENPISKQLNAIRYNPFDRSVLSHTSFEDTTLFYKALNALSEEINSTVNELWIKLTPGRVLMFDNWRLLHGRAAFNGKRVITGCYLPKDQLNSRLRSVAGLTVY